MADEVKDGYYGILKQKPSFEGLSRYRQPFNYELAGKQFHLIMDLDTDYVAHFISGHILEWGAYKQIPQRCYYECAKADETTYFVNFELSGVKPRTGLTVILDLEQRLVTLNKCYTDFSERYPTLDTRCLSGRRSNYHGVAAAAAAKTSTWTCCQIVI